MTRRYADLPHDPRSARPILLYVIGVVLVLLALAAVRVAEAATVPLQCTPPTLYTTNLPITGTITYRFYGGTVPVDSPTCSATVTVADPPAGQSVTYSFQATAIVAGQESAKSNTATKTITTPLPTPLPPTLLVTTGGAVSTAMPDYATFGWKLGPVVGSIPPRIKCDANRRIGEWARVTSAITWTAGRKDYVVARCEPA